MIVVSPVQQSRVKYYTVVFNTCRLTVGGEQYEEYRKR